MTERPRRFRVRALLMVVLAAGLLRCGGPGTGPDDGDDDPTLPAVPELVTPAEGAALSTDTPTFTVRNARRFNTTSSTYTFEVTTRSGARTVATLTVPAGRGTTTAMFAASLPRGMTLRWRAVAAGAAGQAASATASFRTVGVQCESVRGAYAKSVVEWSVPQCSLAQNRYNDPDEVLGPPDAVRTSPPGTPFVGAGFFSLGERGHVTVDMVDCAVDGPGPDLRVYQAVSMEPVTVYAGGSAQGPFFMLEERKPCDEGRLTNVIRYCDFDLSVGEVGEARYFRIEDGEHFPCALAQTDSEGADIDAAQMLNRK